MQVWVTAMGVDAGMWWKILIRTLADQSGGATTGPSGPSLPGAVPVVAGSREGPEILGKGGVVGLQVRGIQLTQSRGFFPSDKEIMDCINHEHGFTGAKWLTMALNSEEHIGWEERSMRTTILGIPIFKRCTEEVLGRKFSTSKQWKGKQKCPKSKKLLKKTGLQCLMLQ